jgi:hypothetical protein
LQLAQHLRLSKVGTVSIDGTKLQANASKHAAVSYARAGEMIAQLELEVQELIGRAQQAENQETKEALNIAAELTRREDRKAALQQARQVIEARAKEMAAAQQADYQAKQARRLPAPPRQAGQAQREAGKKPRGPEPTPPSATPNSKAQYNFTDPESGIMQTAQANRGTGLRHHQRGDGLPALQLEGPCKSLTGVDPGLREL